MTKSARIPGPDHPISITKNPKHVRISVDGVTIAKTANALTLQEAAYPAVQYIPRGDANMSLLTKTAHNTYCPYKGDAGYFTIKAGGKTLENAIWTYEQPYPSVKDIAGHLAFYPDRVLIEELS